MNRNKGVSIYLASMYMLAYIQRTLQGMRCENAAVASGKRRVAQGEMPPLICETAEDPPLEAIAASRKSKVVQGEMPPLICNSRLLYCLLTLL